VVSVLGAVVVPVSVLGAVVVPVSVDVDVGVSVSVTVFGAWLMTVVPAPPPGGW